MEGINLIQDLGIVLLAAGLAGILCKRIGLSVIVGYLVAGVVIGPYTPPFSLVLDVPRIETLSQVGLVFLMFGIGLTLSLNKFRKLGAATIVATGLGAFLVFHFTRLLGRAVGWSSLQSFYIAAMFMVSSSAVIGKIVRDLHLGHEKPAQLAMGITLLEDVVAVVMLAVLASQGSTGAENPASAGRLMFIMGAFVVLLVCVGLALMPNLLRRLDAKADPEVRTIVIAGVLFGIALIAAKAGYSVALGAFWLGAVVAELPQRGNVENAFSGARDMFSSVFFVSIGMMIDVRLVAQVWWPMLGLGLGMMVVRTLATGVALLAVGVPPAEARRASLLLTPIGEFSFLIAQLGVTMQVLSAEYYPIAVGISLLTVLLTPLINRHADRILRVADLVEPGWVRRLQHGYHDWLAQAAARSSGTPWVRLSQKRLLHILVEVFFVTGLIAFSERLLGAAQTSTLAGWLDPSLLKLSFWVLLSLVVLAPIIAIWRNVGAVALILAETVPSGPRRHFVEMGVRAVATLAMVYWLAALLPLSSLPNWTWLLIAGGLILVAALFSRRLIYLHSEWQHSLASALEGEDPAQRPNTQRLLKDQRQWPLQVQECVLPAQAACAGRSLADLQVRTRFGCSVAEIDRHGHTLIAPTPQECLYPGDRLLLLGESAAIAQAREELTRVSAPQGADFGAACLEVVVMPALVGVGSTLADLPLGGTSGVLVVGLERAGRQLAIPEPHEPMQAGDRLLVLGDPAKVREFRRWLETSA